MLQLWEPAINYLSQYPFNLILFVIISSKTAEMKNFSSVLIILDKKIKEIFKFKIRKKIAGRRKKFASEAFGTHRFPAYPPQFFPDHPLIFTPIWGKI